MRRKRRERKERKPVMTPEEFFGRVLGIREPWYVRTAKIVPPEGPYDPLDAPGELHLVVDFRRGRSFVRGFCGRDFPFSLEPNRPFIQTWRAPKCFQYPCVLHLRTPQFEEKPFPICHIGWLRKDAGFSPMGEQSIEELPSLRERRLYEERRRRERARRMAERAARRIRTEAS